MAACADCNESFSASDDLESFSLYCPLCAARRRGDLVEYRRLLGFWAMRVQSCGRDLTPDAERREFERAKLSRRDPKTGETRLLTWAEWKGVA